MKLLLSSLTTLAATLSLLAACGPANIANGTGGTGGASSSSHSTTSTTGTTGTGGSSSNTCVEAGGSCEAVTPGSCMGGVVGDATKYSCGNGVGDLCCLPCPPACPTAGATRCAGDAIQTCTSNAIGCLSWVLTSACPATEECNSDASKCIAPTTMCATSADCGCGCGCNPAGTCLCTGGIPPTCNADSDCGAACSGLLCVAHQCQLQACTPGMDQECNDNAAMNALAGSCDPNGTCACKQGFTLKPSGKCG